MLDKFTNSSALLRLPQIIGRKATQFSDATLPLIPVSKSTWWAGVRSGRFPRPVKIGARCTAWRLSDILALIERMGAQAGGNE